MSEVVEQIHEARPRRFRPYAEYKDSGIDWLGAIPAHWSVLALKRIGDLQAGGGFPDHEQGILYEEIPFFKVGDMAAPGNERYMRAWQHTVSRATARRLRAFVFPTGTVVFAKVGAALMLNRRRLLAIPSCLDNNMMGFIPGACDACWAMHWLTGLDMGELANPGAVPSVNEGQMRATPAVVPPLDEQHAIAAFLDRETAKIDGLVVRKERLIELLQEKRTALITRAVTRGLDPNVPMKDSGVEWLGEIPTHWEVKRIKWAARMESGHTPDKKVDAYWQDGDVPWVSLNDTRQLKDHDYITETEYCTNELGLRNSSARLLPARTVVFSRDATIGLCAITECPMAVSQHFIAWVCGEDLRPEYLLRVFDVMQGELERLTMGATLRTIGMPDVKELTAPLPPIDEQDAIVKHILGERREIDGLVTKIRQAIDHLKEFRTALISAAVTGKIDVREELA